MHIYATFSTIISLIIQLLIKFAIRKSIGTPIAYYKNTVNLEKMLLKFSDEPDPMLSILEWLCHNL